MVAQIFHRIASQQKNHPRLLNRSSQGPHFDLYYLHVYTQYSNFLTSILLLTDYQKADIIVLDMLVLDTTQYKENMATL